jgi:hypothetical protein
MLADVDFETQFKVVIPFAASWESQWNWLAENFGPRPLGRWNVWYVNKEAVYGFNNEEDLILFTLRWME